MKGLLLATDCKIYDITDNVNDKDPDNIIRWKTCTFLFDGEVQSLTVDEKISDKLKPMSIYNLAIQVTENIQSARSGGYYKTHKFKIVEASLAK